MAELLGKPAAAMFPSGIMAQQSALRVSTDRQASLGSRSRAVPPARYEPDGPQQLNSFRYERLTSVPTVATAEDLAAIPGPVGRRARRAAPARRGLPAPDVGGAGGPLVAARERGVPVHSTVRGSGSPSRTSATPWPRSRPSRTRSTSRLYKGLGGLAGALVAGPQDVVDETRRWRSRHGGTLFSMTPYALAGLRGLRTQLPLMGRLYDRAVELAVAFEQRGFRVSAAAADQLLPDLRRPARARGQRADRAHPRGRPPRLLSHCSRARCRVLPGPSSRSVPEHWSGPSARRPTPSPPSSADPSP